MLISEHVFKTYLKELAIFLKGRETFKKVIEVCNVSKNTAFPQVFFCYILGTIIL